MKGLENLMSIERVSAALYIDHLVYLVTHRQLFHLDFGYCLGIAWAGPDRPFQS
jgi:hypothetical protein